MVPGWVGGESGVEYAEPEEKFRIAETMYVGEVLRLEIRRPKAAGMELAGAGFDPSMLRLDSVLDDPDDTDNPGVVLYDFTALESGQTIITIRARQGKGSEPAAYKIVELKIER